jgi:hypothetical protein
VVIGVQSPSAGGFGGGNTVASFVAPVAAQGGGPAAGTFLPGAGAVLEGCPGYAAGEPGYISGASWALWLP